MEKQTFIEEAKDRLQNALAANTPDEMFMWTRLASLSCLTDALQRGAITSKLCNDATTGIVNITFFLADQEVGHRPFSSNLSEPIAGITHTGAVTK